MHKRALVPQQTKVLCALHSESERTRFAWWESRHCFVSVHNSIRLAQVHMEINCENSWVH
jgi:hypothetical protein